MKTCKKALAIVLSLCMLLSMTAICASADNVTIWYVPVKVTSAKAVSFKEGDPETVMRLELNVERVSSGESSAPAGSFEKVDTNAEITIYDGLYVSVYETLSAITEVDDQNVFETAMIAKAKPVSYENGVLTVDVFSKNGEAGAKMVSMKFDAFEASGLGGFYFDFPRGMLSDADGLLFNNAGRSNANVDGLQIKTLELPSLVKSIFNDFATGNFSGLLGKAIFILPLSFIIIPILLKKMESSTQKVYDIYGISVHQLFADAGKAVRKIIPYLIGSFF